MRIRNNSVIAGPIFPELVEGSAEAISMKFTILKTPAGDMKTRIMRCGYHEHRDPRTGKTSFSHRLGSYHYPRFHLYVEDRANDVLFDLHLDQKQPSYAGSHMHAGEYDGDTVEREAERLQTILQSPTS